MTWRDKIKTAFQAAGYSNSGKRSAFASYNEAGRELMSGHPVIMDGTNQFLGFNNSWSGKQKHANAIYDGVDSAFKRKTIRITLNEFEKEKFALVTSEVMDGGLQPRRRFNMDVLQAFGPK